MAKKLSDIKQKVESSSNSFIQYLNRNIESGVISKIYELLKYSDVYFFSGVIRDFFLKKNKIRDIDIVLSSKCPIEEIFADSVISKNSFGGYKIITTSITIDIWYLHESWAFKHQRTLDFALEKQIAKTAFFNFSAVIFDLKNNNFNYTIHFLRFLRDKKIDVVFEPNQNTKLCVVNTLYYADKFNLKISSKLKKYIIQIYRGDINEFSNVQIKHFGQVLYSDTTIKERICEFAEKRTLEGKFDIINYYL